MDKPVVELSLANGATLLQVNIYDEEENTTSRIYIKTVDIFRLLNNHLYAELERQKELEGFFKIKDEPNENFIN